MTLTSSHRVFDWIKSKGGEEVETYFGPFDFNVINDKLIEIKEFFNQTNFEKIKNKTAYSILVESLENVIKHGEYKGHTAAFMLHNDDEHYFITVVNPIGTETAREVKSKFDTLYSHPVEKIRELRIKQLREGTISERGGAGLGLMEMLIKSDKKVSLEMVDFEDEVILMVLNITV